MDAVKLYDAAVSQVCLFSNLDINIDLLSQFAGWYDDSNLGGLETTLNKLYEADPDFGIHCIVLDSSFKIIFVFSFGQCSDFVY